MIYLLQILRMLNKKQQKEFVALFSDLDYELNDMGWKGDETTLINDMLFNHFGLSVEDNGQHPLTLHVAKLPSGSFFGLAWDLQMQ